MFYDYEGIFVEITFSKHAHNERCRQRRIFIESAQDAIVRALDDILDFKDGAQFIVRDHLQEISVVAGLRMSRSGDITINVITVIDCDDAYAKKGTEIIDLDVPARQARKTV